MGNIDLVNKLVLKERSKLEQKVQDHREEILAFLDTGEEE